MCPVPPINVDGVEDEAPGAGLGEGVPLLRLRTVAGHTDPTAEPAGQAVVDFVPLNLRRPPRRRGVFGDDFSSSDSSSANDYSSSTPGSLPGLLGPDEQSSSPSDSSSIGILAHLPIVGREWFPRGFLLVEGNVSFYVGPSDGARVPQGPLVPHPQPFLFDFGQVTLSVYCDDYHLLGVRRLLIERPFRRAEVGTEARAAFLRNVMFFFHVREGELSRFLQRFPPEFLEAVLRGGDPRRRAMIDLFVRNPVAHEQIIAQRAFRREGRGVRVPAPPGRMLDPVVSLLAIRRAIARRAQEHVREQEEVRAIVVQGAAWWNGHFRVYSDNVAAVAARLEGRGSDPANGEEGPEAVSE